MNQHFCDYNFKNYTTEDLLDTAKSDSPDVSTWLRISAKSEIESRVLERMMEMGMPTIMKEAYEKHQARLKKIGWR